MADNKKYPALSGLSSSIKQEAELEGMRYKNDAALRSPHEDDADLFDDIANSANSPGGRPRGLGANLVSGISKGVAYGSRSMATSEKKEKLGKHENVMKYLRESQAAITEQNQYYAEQEKKLETVKPFAIGGLEVAYSGMDYNTGNERMRNIIEQAKLADPSIKGDYIGYVPNSPIVNLRNEKGDIIAYSLSNLVGEDVVKRVQGNYISEQKMKTEQQYAPVKYQMMGDRLEETKRRNNQSALKQDIKLSETLGKKIDSSREFLTIVPKMEKIVNEHPDIFQSAIDATWREASEPGFMTNMLKDVQNKWNPEKVAALTSMVKYINKMTLDVANGFARPNMFIEKIGSKAVPNLDMNPEGFKQVLQEMKHENETSLKNNLERFKLLESDAGTGIANQYQQSTNEIMGGQQTSPLASFGRRVN